MRRLSSIAKTICVMMVGSLSSAGILAQDSIHSIDPDFDITVFDKRPFYAQLWFWIVLGFVFLLLLIFLLRGSGGKKKNEKVHKEQGE